MCSEFAATVDTLEGSGKHQTLVHHGPMGNLGQTVYSLGATDFLICQPQLPYAIKFKSPTKSRKHASFHISETRMCLSMASFN